MRENKIDRQTDIQTDRQTEIDNMREKKIKH